MIKHFLFFFVFAATTAFITKRIIIGNEPQFSKILIQATEAKKAIAIGCSPDWKYINSLSDENDIPIIPGCGNYTWHISTKSDSAQIYFNQGINMYYSFHIIEAMASFKKAVKFDSSCAILYWAQ